MLEAGMQQGSLIRRHRKRGPDVWQFRWADRGPFGKRIYRRRVIGTVCQYPDADSARKSVAGLLTEINMNGVKRCALPMTIAEVRDHFIQRELTNDNLWRSYSTKRAYRAYLKKWIVPHWGNVRLKLLTLISLNPLPGSATSLKNSICSSDSRDFVVSV
jgi:integrase